MPRSWTTPLARKAQSGDSNAGKTTVKMKVDLHRKARTVASYNGLELADYIDQVLRPIIDKAFAEMAREIQDGESGRAKGGK